MSVLKVSGLSVERGGTPIVRRIDLSLARGEVVALLGPNGAGKSTLLAALAGLLPASAGTVSADGRVAIALQDAVMARRTALANVELAMRWWGVRERAGRAQAALDALSAGHLASRPARELSGGERRRVHLARVLVVQPDVLLLDEPFAGLDTDAHNALLDDLAPLLRAGDRSAIVVVHDQADAWALADRIVVLVDGAVAASGRPDEVRESPPTPEVARLLGYDGEYVDGSALVLTRSDQVRVAPSGGLPGTVRSARRTPGGWLLRVDVPGGSVAVATEAIAQVGDEVRLITDAAVQFPATD